MTDAREPKPCPVCGEVCKHDGWDHVHSTGLGIGSCRPAVARQDQGTDDACVICGYTEEEHRTDYHLVHSFWPPAPADVLAKLREAVARWLYRHTGRNEDDLPALADELLDGPLAPVLAQAAADRKAVQRVEALANECDRMFRTVRTDLLRAALRGDQ